MSRIQKFFIFNIIFLMLALRSLGEVRAQLPDFAITTTHKVADLEIVDGDIISMSKKDGTFHRSETTYDETMHGVYIFFPKVAYRTPENDRPIARSGDVEVNVTNFNGNINIGDYVSSSPIPGKGMMATEFTGYMLGVALEPFNRNNGTDINFKNKNYKLGKIKVAIGIGPASPSVIKNSGGLFGTIRFLGSSLMYNIANSKQAERILKIILAVIIAVSSIALSIHFFGKNVTQGLESIGRNPLAKSTIQTMIILNVILIASIAIGGIIIALVIISL